TLDSKLQRVASAAVVDGLLTYDSRHGYRGPEQQLLLQGERQGERQGKRPADAPLPLDVPLPLDAPLPLDEWLVTLGDTPVIADLEPAAVIAIDDTGITVLLADGEQVRVEWENGLRQARRYISEDRIGSAPATPADVVAIGDLIRVQSTGDNSWRFSQVPSAQAALISLNPSNGAIVSLVGGIGFEKSKFNRATQAQRQPGSNLKPFLYSAALDAGFTAASIINDAPIVMEDRSLEGVWRPENDGGQFFGPTRLRWALTKSRNLVSIRLLQQLGVRRFIDYAEKLGFDTQSFAPDLSLALGTHAMTPMDIAAAYAILANGGYRVEPFLIERIDSLSGETLFTARPATVCRACEGNADSAAKPANPQELSMEEILAVSEQEALPAAERVMDERVNFIIDDILQDVIKQGTGRRALVLKRDDLAGKTGTTNGPMDAWFSGYNPDVVTTAWVGFDNYTPLGRREFGGTAALPIWINYMREALDGIPERPRSLPPGISYLRIDPVTGLLAPADQRDAIFEYFRNEHLPEGSEGANTGPTGTDDLIQEIF
ncbi:MAG: penicillin-binding transpeptidase domain-containing protein, partial [Congregibacter sp.]|nr:penicillin-binding transpeptidase domain-containing protein [Congregibacter sp.]